MLTLLQRSLQWAQKKRLRLPSQSSLYCSASARRSSPDGQGQKGLGEPSQNSTAFVSRYQSVESARSQLAKRWAICNGQLIVIAGGKAAVATALQAVAKLHGPELRKWSPVFQLTVLSAEELAETGLPYEGASARRDEEGANVTLQHTDNGIQLEIVPRHSEEMKLARQVEKIHDVLKVSSTNPHLLPLCKAIATEVAKLPPEGGSVVVETALFGSTNMQTRLHFLALAVGYAAGWQERPENPTSSVRPFRCIAQTFEGLLPPREAQPAKRVDMLRLHLVPLR